MCTHTTPCRYNCHLCRQILVAILVCFHVWFGSTFGTDLPWWSVTDILENVFPLLYVPTDPHRLVMICSLNVHNLIVFIVKSC